MNLIEKLSQLNRSKSINITAQNNLVKKTINFLKNNINSEFELNENNPEITCKFITDEERFEEYVNNKEDEVLYLIDIQIISKIYKRFPLLYILFEEEMKKTLSSNNIDMKLINFLYADVMKTTINKEFEIFSFNLNNENYQITDSLIRCAWPWYNMYIRGNTLEWCCGYVHTDEKQTWDEKTEKLDILKEWSSEPFQKVRNILATEDKKGNCSSCHNLYFEQFFPYIFDFLELTTIQQDNLNKVIYNYWVKRPVVDSFPVRYEIITSYKCNINCIMCNQEEYNKLKYELPVCVIEDNKEHLKKAIDISLLGGEFFAVQNAKKILDIFATKDFENVRFLFITNGTLIHRYFEQLKKIKKIIISFSLDTIGENYEYIRQGASWEKVEKNIIDFIKMYKEEKKKDPSLNWQIQSPAIMMKSSIPSLYEYVVWCIEHDIQPAFIKLEPYGVNVDKEDIFRNKELLNEIDNWKDIFEKSLSLLKNKNLYHSYNTLNEIYKQCQGGNASTVIQGL